MATFPGMFVTIESSTRDENYWIVKTSSDVSEGTYYLYDRTRRRMLHLAVARDGVKESDLASMKPISFPSFDGLEVNGYFTHALGTGDKPAPMVVLVHGGPQARDRWDFDAEVQALATNGYSVLQINYRGSTGYGQAFEEAGDRQWGDAVQKDLISGTRWAVEQGLAPKGKVCIAGGSFGAYSAVQSAELAPDLFACAVANAGIYDLPLLYERGDIEQMYFGEASLDKAIGKDETELGRYSPVNNVASLEAPLLIAHGKQDKRAPYKHATNLRKALDRQKKDYEWYVVREATHGFYDIESRVEYMNRMLKFLGRHL
jgi:dipeptidyl aminopeptidase/acylaminoacyl peptidase